MAAQKKTKQKKTKFTSTKKPEVVKEEESAEKEEQKPQEGDSQVTTTETEKVSPQAEKPESEDDDISKYTIGSSGKAPIQDGKKKAQAKKGETEKDIRGREVIPMETRNKKMYVAGIILSVLILGATATTLYFRFRQGSGATEEVAVEVEETQEGTEVEEQPSATALLRSEISLEILNGSGIAGLASETADTFEELGYEVVKVGNAEDTTGNKLYVDPDIEELIAVLLEDVEGELDISSISGELTDSTASVRIILGE